MPYFQCLCKFREQRQRDITALNFRLTTHFRKVVAPDCATNARLEAEHISETKKPSDVEHLERRGIPHIEAVSKYKFARELTMVEIA